MSNDQPLFQISKILWDGSDFKLLKLRNSWKKEIEYKLHHIEESKKEFWNWFLIDTSKSKDKKIVNQFSDFEELLYLCDFATEFDIAVCSSIMHPLSIDDDLASMAKIKKLMREKSAFLSGKNKEFSVAPYIKYINNYRNKYLPCKELIQLKVDDVEVLEDVEDEDEMDMNDKNAHA